MKRWIYSIIICICLSLPALAQQNKKIEAVKIAFITQRLDLSTEESQRFWPVYNNYQQDMLKLHKDRQIAKRSGGTVDEIKFESDMLDLRKRYRAEFSKVLPQQKVPVVFQAEREFRQQLIQQLDKRKEKN